MSALTRFPQECWDIITSLLPTASAIAGSKSLKYELDSYDQVWAAVFKSEKWLNSPGAQSANIVLIGTDLDSLSGAKQGTAQPHVALMAYSKDGDIYYERELLSSALGIDYKGPGSYKLNRALLSIGSLSNPEITGTDFRYLFSKKGLQLETKYCYWNDPEKRIRTLQSPDIKGIGGPIRNKRKLSPIFLLHVDKPPVQKSSGECLPEQFIFRNFGGPSAYGGRLPLVDAIQGAENSAAGGTTLHGFRFKDKKHKKYHRQKTDWSGIAANAN